MMKEPPFEFPGRGFGIPELEVESYLRKEPRWRSLHLCDGISLVHKLHQKSGFRFIDFKLHFIAKTRTHVLLT